MLLPMESSLKNKFYFVNFLKFVFFNFNFIIFANLLVQFTSKFFSLKGAFKSDLFNFFLLTSAFASRIFSDYLRIDLLKSKILLLFSNNIDNLFFFISNARIDTINIIAFLYKNYFISISDFNVLFNFKKAFDFNLLNLHIFSIIRSFFYFSLFF
jgi:hypothetical protein